MFLQLPPQALYASLSLHLPRQGTKKKKNKEKGIQSFYLLFLLFSISALKNDHREELLRKKVHICLKVGLGLNDREISQLSEPGPLPSTAKLHNAKEECKQNVKWNKERETRT